MRHELVLWTAGGPNNAARALGRLKGPALRFIALLWFAAFTGCAPMSNPVNHSDVFFDREKAGRDRDMAGFATSRNLSFSQQQCPPAGTAGFIMSSPLKHPQNLRKLPLRYSPGDRLNIFVPSSADFSGDYVVNFDGTIIMPFSTNVAVAGLTNDEVAARVSKTLAGKGLFRGDQFEVSVRPVQYWAVNITISGAVFLPGRVAVGGVKESDKLPPSYSKSGDLPGDRYIDSALRAGGGVRPDANLARVKLVRGGKTYILNWTGAILGDNVDNVALIDDDHIEVEEAGCFQSALVRPSQITPPGIRIFQSNLTVPATANAQSGISQQSQNIPYGTRFLAGLVSTNCVGGSLASNAGRYGVLISRNPKTGRTEVIQRSIEELVKSADRDEINPYLMPDDAIACYDSAITDLREVANVVQSVLVPAQTGHVLRQW